MNLSKNLDNNEIAELFRRVAAVYSVQNKSGFRIHAYENAAVSIEQFPSSLKEMWQQGRLDEVPGIGEKITAVIKELFETGHSKHIEDIINSEPAGMFPLLNIPGIGPKTAFKLAHEFKLVSEESAVEQVRDLAKEGKIRTLPGFSEVSETKILQSIEGRNKQYEKRLLLMEAQLIVKQIMDYLYQSPDVIKCEGLGSFRRRVATVGDIDIAVATKDPNAVMAYVRTYPQIKEIVNAGEKMLTFIHATGWQVDIKTQYPERWGSMLQHYTGSKLHNIHLRTIAKEKGMSLSENGIKRGEETEYFSDEKSFYHALGMDFVPPELREDAGEIEAAIAHKLPHLIEPEDIKGDFHIHTSIDSPISHDKGASTVAELLEEAEKMGYMYLGLSDHNPKQSGLTTEERLQAVKERNEIIEKEYAAYKQHHKNAPRVFKGMEIDILPDGSLALEDEAIELLDYAIVSIHSQFTLPREQMTERVLKGLAHPKVKIFGHPTARMMPTRGEIDCDWRVIFDYCIKHTILLEINASGQRMDLPSSLILEAHKMGAKFIINTDSHHRDYMQNIVYGVSNARRGWLEAKDVVNTYSLENLTEIFES